MARASSLNVLGYFGFVLLPLEVLVSAPFELELLVDDVSSLWCFFDFDEVDEVPLVSLPMVLDEPVEPVALSEPVEPVVLEEPDVPSELSLPDEVVPAEPEVEPELPDWVTPEPVTPLLF